MQMQSLDSIYRKRRFPSLAAGLVAAVAILALAVGAVVLSMRGCAGDPAEADAAAPEAGSATTNADARAQAPRAPDLPPEAYEEGTLTRDAFLAAMEKAKEFDRLGRLYDERAVLLEALAQAGSAYRGALEEELGALSGRIYFTNVPGPDKAEVAVDAPLATIAARHNCPVALIQRMNGIADPDRVQSGRRLVVLHDPKFEVRVSILGHLQRGGSPSAHDRILASRTGVGAIEAIIQGQRNVMVGVRNNEVVYVPFSECIRTDKPFNKKLIRVLDELSI